MSEIIFKADSVYKLIDGEFMYGIEYYYIVPTVDYVEGLRVVECWVTNEEGDRYPGHNTTETIIVSQIGGLVKFRG